MLGFGAFFWFFVIAPTAAAQRDPNALKYLLAQSYIALNCLMLLACGVLLMHSGATPIRRATSRKIAGSGLPGRPSSPPTVGRVWPSDR